MAGPRLPWGRLAAFAALPVLSAVAPVFLIPIVASEAGAGGWAAVALGQSLGAGVATMMQYGWALTGPSRFARTQPEERRSLLWLSTASRLIVAAVLCPVAAGAAAMLAPQGNETLAVLTTLAFATFGLSGFWYFVALGRAGLAAKYETIPRLAVLLVAGFLVLETGAAVAYPALLLGGQVAGLLWLNLALGDVSLTRETWRSAMRVLREQRTAAGTDVVAAAYHALPAAIVAATAPGSLATFASGERLQRLAQSGVQPLVNAFQGWTTEAPANDLRRRMYLSVGVTSAVGTLAGLTFALALPVVDFWVFAGEVEISALLSTCFGVALALLAVTTSLNFHVLAPRGASMHSLRGAIVGLVVLVSGLAVLPAAWGAPGGAVSLVLSQLSVLAVQVPACRRLV